MNEHDTVLNGRYTLISQISRPEIEPSELWEATDYDDNQYTLKITPYIGEKPPSEVRRLWDNDLRVMYRLSSSSGADRQLVVMTDAGIDINKHVMVLVYKGSEYVTFAEMLKDREKGHKDWLSFNRLKARNARMALWLSLLQLARGLKSLHEQNLIHRNVIPEAIWGHQSDGAESLRLSGFDWGARIGHTTNIAERSHWATPPELDLVGYSFVSDWYGFGTTVARCFYKVEHLKYKSPSDHAAALAEVILKENPCNLEPLEKAFIKAIAAPSRDDRLQRSTDIIERISKIIEALDFGHEGKNDGRRVLLHVDHKTPKLIDVARRAGFIPNPDNPFEGFDPMSDNHKNSLKDFLTKQLRNTLLSWSTNGNEFELKCPNLFIRGERWMNFGNSKEQSWKAAKAKYLNHTTGVLESIPSKGFNSVQIEIEFSSHEVNKKIEPGSKYSTWDTFAPKNDTSQGLDYDSENLRQFLHISNQFEVLLRDAELFKYRIINQTVEQSKTTITITSIDEERPSRTFFKADKKLVDFLQQEKDSAKNWCDEVLLTESDSLFVSRASANSASDSFDVDKEKWTISEIDRQNETISLFRQDSNGIAQPSPEGYLRTRGHYGQIRLIERRKQSIDRLSSHAYLLRTLASPYFTHIDTGASELPWRELEKTALVDGNKLATIKDILRVRPMYALQGPPGTGKSTLVAHLLRQILEDDPMAQILVTAKDHAAVDVLLDKVIGQAYKEARKEQYPLAIRLNRRDGNDHAQELVDKLVHTALTAIGNQPQIDNAIQHRWYKQLEQLKASRRTEASAIPADTQRLSNALLDLVRGGASITYCTTSSGDLEELAKGSHSFDWSIIEEAGKTHGFDLALPLQAGHRWLLLGDHKQLRPFLYDEFADCFNRLDGEDGVIKALENIGEKRGNTRLIDVQWIKAKIDADSNWAESFSSFSRRWIASFARIFEQRSEPDRTTLDESIGASAGLLKRQYRMPPAIGDLNSTVFYKGEVANATADPEGYPDAHHRNPLVAPSRLIEKSLIWLDMPWVDTNKETQKKGYSNHSEQEAISRLLKMMKAKTCDSPSTLYTIAILTPYNMQKTAINRCNIEAPEGCQFGSAQSLDSGKLKAYSVDSFQGDEADIIVVSFVRNKLNTGGMPRPSDINFIAQPDRLNVMLSRSRRMLVIVGCWDYLNACMTTVSAATDGQGNYDDPDYGPFKKTLEQLNAMFNDGRALKISVEKALQ